MVNAIAGSLAKCITMAVMTTVMGPVGPDTCAGVPPKTAAKKPTIIAPYNPANGPAPEVTPKASGKRQGNYRGRQTTVDVAAYIIKGKPVNETIHVYDQRVLKNVKIIQYIFLLKILINLFLIIPALR